MTLEHLAIAIAQWPKHFRPEHNTWWPLANVDNMGTSASFIELCFRVFACSRRWARKAYGRPDFITDTILPITHTPTSSLSP